MIGILEQVKGISGGGGNDAQAFIDATQITEAGKISAINTLVDDLKSFGIWNKMIAIYPIISDGINQTREFQHKFNLKNPVDTNAAFRLAYVGTLTHSANGVVGDGSTGFIRTNINGLNNLLNSNLSLSFYSRTNSNLGAFSAEISVDASYTAANWVTFRVNNKTSGNAYFSAGNDNVGATLSSTLGNGFFIGNETANNSRALIRNGTTLASNATADNNALPNAGLNLFGSSGSNKSSNQCAFASFGLSLTAQNIIDFNSIVQGFQVALGRNV